MPKSFKVIPFALVLFITCSYVGCSPNNVTVDNSLQRYFDSAGIKGSFGFFDNGQGHFTIYNLSRFSDSTYQPGATFDILRALIAIQTGIAKDGKDFDPQTTRIGKDTMKKWVDSLQYGNKNISDDTTRFWDNNQLKINSDEQLGLIKKLYFDQLPFFPHTQLLVRQMLSGENNSNYQLRYKTAQGIKEDGHAIAWVMGWIEENKHPYFFVINLESVNAKKEYRYKSYADKVAVEGNTDLDAAGLVITKGILKEMGFFQGKK